MSWNRPMITPYRISCALLEYLTEDTESYFSRLFGKLTNSLGALNLTSRNDEVHDASIKLPMVWK